MKREISLAASFSVLMAWSLTLSAQPSVAQGGTQSGAQIKPAGNTNVQPKATGAVNFPGARLPGTRLPGATNPGRVGVGEAGVGSGASSLLPNINTSPTLNLGNTGIGNNPIQELGVGNNVVQGAGLRDIQQNLGVGQQAFQEAGVADNHGTTFIPSERGFGDLYGPGSATGYTGPFPQSDGSSTTEFDGGKTTVNVGADGTVTTTETSIDGITTVTITNPDGSDGTAGGSSSGSSGGSSGGGSTSGKGGKKGGSGSGSGSIFTDPTKGGRGSAVGNLQEGNSGLIEGAASGNVNVNVSDLRPGGAAGNLLDGAAGGALQNFGNRLNNQINGVEVGVFSKTGGPVPGGAEAGGGFKSGTSPFAPGGRFSGVPAPGGTTGGAGFSPPGAGRLGGGIISPRDPASIGGSRIPAALGAGNASSGPGNTGLPGAVSGAAVIQRLPGASGAGGGGLPGVGAKVPVGNIVPGAGIRPNLPTFSGGAGAIKIPTAGSFNLGGGRTSNTRPSGGGGATPSQRPTTSTPRPTIVVPGRR